MDASDTSLSAATIAYEAHMRAAEPACTKPGQRAWLEHKRRHTYAVLAATDRMLLADPMLRDASPAEQHTWRCAALFHDLGRADELVQRGAMGTGGFGHAAASESHLLTLPAWASDTPLIVAVSSHSCRSPDIALQHPRYRAADAATQSACIRAVGVVRDADKLANLEWLASTSFRDLRTDQSPGPLSPRVRQQLERGMTVCTADVVTDQDRIALFIGWLADIAYPGTMHLIHASGLIPAMRMALLRLPFPPDADAVNQWINAALERSRMQQLYGQALQVTAADC